MLKNTEKLAAEVVPVLEQQVDILKRVLKEKLTGVYVHGSAVMGGFNPRHSDLDYLVLIAAPLTPEEREQLSSELLLIYGTSGFKKGVEMSVVVDKFAGKDFRYPTPYEFHMGTEEQLRFHSKPHEHELIDPDLASHFYSIYKRGVSVYGKEVAEVFYPIDKSYYLQSVKSDIENASSEITGNPLYFVLNLCRTIYEIRDDTRYSKKEGGELYLADKSRDDYKELVKNVLDEYTTGHSYSYDSEELHGFAVKILGEINISLGQ